MTITLKKVLETLITNDANAVVNVIGDGIDALGNENVRVIPSRNYTEYTDSDASVVTVLNSDGTVASASSSNSVDKVFKSIDIDLVRPSALKLYIPRFEYGLYGISADMLDVNAKRFGYDKIDSLTKSGKLADELNKMYKKFYNYRRNQVHAFLSGLATSTLNYQNTVDGDKLCADNRTGHVFDFDNKSTAALSEYEFKVGINAIAGQVDILGNEVGATAPKYLFHSGNLPLANEILKPNEVVNAQYKSAGDFKVVTGGTWACRYTNGTDLNDWVLITEGHKIERLIVAGYEIPQVRIVHEPEEDRILIEMSDWTILKCTDPTHIYAGIVS